MAITVKHTKVSTIPDGDDSSLIRPSDWNDDHTLIGLGTMAEQDANSVAITGGTISGVTLPASNITGTLGVPNGGTGATTLTGYVKGTGTTAMTASATIPNTDITGLGTASTKDAGVANGVATLDAGGKVPVSELPAAVLGALNYQGTWNASTNTPTLTSSTGTKGYYYVVAVAGSTDLDGITDWLVGDWAVYNGSVWQKVDNTDAGGDVVGPASATDNAIARFDTTTGKLIQNSTVTISDTGAIAGAESISNIDFAQFDTTVTPVEAVGKLQWDDGNGTLQVGLKGGNVNLQVGQEIVALCYNDSGVALTDGQIVYISGAQGNRVAVKLALATTDGSSAGTLGMVTESIAIGAEGFVTILGTVNKLNTLGLTQGAILYLSPTTAGAYTQTKPVAPQHTVTIGYVERVSATVGSIYVKVDNGYELDELHNVRITTPTGGQLLAYDETNQYWKNINLTDGTAISITETTGGAITITNTGVTSAVAGTGISVSGATGAVTVTNTAPDQVVSLTGGGTTTISGTYPNFTISSDDQFDGTVTSVDLTAGTGISVSGGPITASGSITVTNTAPDQTVAIASGTGISVTGTYPNFTVTNTAPSSGGTVTSVSGTAGRITSTGGTTPVIDLASGVATAGTTGSSTLIPVVTIDTYGRVTGITTAANPQGTVTSVAALTLGTSGTDLSSTVANGTTTPVITLNVPTASAVNRGALSAADWTTFNNKAAPFTYTTGYIPYGQGTTTPNQSASLTFASSTLTAPVVSASNGLVVNSNTVSATFSIPSGSSAMSAGPITINSGVSVTVPSGGRWVIS